jgi:hypothetical protein|uniref:hypothetical protein n=1 Tax=Phocaeicola plebeius TaxID=310297 RepID=UPI0026EBD32D|nr:hypothetical protein [Phocaeicola plebeius]
MKTMNLKFMSMAAMVAMAMFTACSEDDNTPNPNPEPEPNPNPDVTVEGYSSDLFVAEANHNVIEYDFSNTFKDGFIGTIDGGADMPKVNEFFEAAAYRGAVSADNNWTEGWIRTSGNGDETSANAEEILQGELTTNKTLEANKVYALSGDYIVKTGATLTIQEGVKIVAMTDDESVDYILVQQGAKIEAVGTKENPIIMTSDKKESGAWGGLHICGKAHTNAEGGTGKSEIGDAAYGGSADNDNSGTLKYIRLENTGYALDSEHEANGISFYGVGNGTTVEYVQAYNGSDDGFEFFGGSVDVKHMVVTNCSDDSFDWTEGWNGRGQFLVAYQEAKETLGFDCDCLMECDNNGKNFAATPVACPTLANLTLIGNGGEKQGVRLRAGTQVKMYNALISGKGKCLTTETTETEKALVDGTSVLNYVTLATDIECNGAEE